MQLKPIDFLDQGAAGDGTRECLVEGTLRLSYAEVQRWTHKIAWALQREGVKPGDAVTTLSPNGAWGYLLILALFRAGCIWVPLNARSPASEWRGQITRTRAKWLFLHAEFSAHADGLVEGTTLGGHLVFGAGNGAGELRAFVAETPDTAFVFEEPLPQAPVFRITQSGGTTGAPKGIVQSQAGLVANVATLMAVAPHAAPRYLLCNPMTHAAGVLAFPILAMSGAIVFMRRPDPEELPRVIKDERITITLVAPTSIYAMLENPLLDSYDLSSLRYFMFGTAPMPHELLVRASEKFGDVLMQGYAQSEASTLIAVMRPSDYVEALADPRLVHRLRSCGRPGPFARIEIMKDDGTLCAPHEIGEIVVRSPMVMLGYFDNPEATQTTREHGWHHTTDVGYLDDDGFLYVVDRKRDMIISGGFNVYPSEIEQLIEEDPAITACAVIGVRDERWGEAVKAVIELKPGVDIDVMALERRCKEHLGSVKCPKSFDIWPALPRSALGKILKKDIRAHYA